MESTSVRNLANHVAAVSYANFRPVVETWYVTNGLPQGCCEPLKLILDTTGARVNPISPDFLLNKDYISQYDFCGNS